METEGGYVLEWRIENLSLWCAEVHGKSIKSPELYYYCYNMELYPKGISGQEEHLVLRFGDIKYPSAGDLSLYCSDGTLLCKQPANSAQFGGNLDLPLGPKFQEVLSRIRESEDFITVRYRRSISYCYKQRTCTTINGFKISFKINPMWIEKMNSDKAEKVCYIDYSTNAISKRMDFITFSKKNTVYFTMDPTRVNEFPIAVEVCIRLTRSDDTVYSRVRKEHVFRDKSPWIFPDPLDKKESVGKGISLFFCIKTKNVVQCYSYWNHEYDRVSIELGNKICFSEPSTKPATSMKDSVAVLTKDSGRQTSATPDIPDDSVLVLTKDLMCLYQDQKFSDLELKCGNVSFAVHRNILSARSLVFDRLLSCDMQEATSGQVIIGDLDPSTLGLFLTYLYTGAVEDLECDRALKLYYAADKYQVPSLKRECSDFLCSNVSISNVCDILSLANRHSDDSLTAVSHSFMLTNYDDLMRSKEWGNFMESEPLLALKTVTQFSKNNSIAFTPLS